MKFYVATKLENHEAHNRVRDFVAELGHEVTYDWTAHGPVHSHGLERIEEVALAEILGVADADVVVVLWPGGRGTHVEMGAAIALGKTVLMVSEITDHHEATPETCAFYHHPNVELFRSERDLFQFIRNLSAGVLE